MFGQLVASFGLFAVYGIALDAVEATCLYLFSLVFLLLGAFGNAYNGSLFDSQQIGPLTYQPNMDNYVKYLSYIGAGCVFAILYTALATSVATVASEKMKRAPRQLRERQRRMLFLAHSTAPRRQPEPRARMPLPQLYPTVRIP